MEQPPHETSTAAPDPMPPISPVARPIHPDGNEPAGPQDRFGDAGPWRRALLEIIGVIGAFLVLTNAALHGLHAVAPHLSMDWANIIVYLASSTPLLPLMLAIVWFSRRPLASIGIRSNAVAFDLTLGAGLGGMFLVVVVGGLSLMALFFPELTKDMLKAQKNIEANFPRMSPVRLILMTAWVAVFEEVLFRGFLFTRMRALTGSWWAASIPTTILFTLVHTYEGGISMAAVALLSFVLCAAFAIRRSVLPAIAMHFVFNIVQLLLMYVTSGSWT